MTSKLCSASAFLLCTMPFISAGPLYGQTLTAPEVGQALTAPDVNASDHEMEPMVIIDGDEITVPGTVSAPEVIVDEVIVDAETAKPSELKVTFGDWVGYNATQSNTTWLAGGDFGMFSLESYPALKFGNDSAVSFGTGFHFLNGPSVPDMPPRLFDFQLAYQARKQFSQRTMFDVRLGVGAFSDFEGSARKGIRFPGHAVGYYECHSELASVFGVEVLDRDDISVLPVGGFVWRPFDDLVLECIFPRPRIQLKLDSDSVMYFGGELGGGTWAIKRHDASKDEARYNDNATYRDLRVTWGIARFDDESNSALEIGWAFDRSLEYRSNVGNTDFDGALVLRCHTHY